MEKKHCYPANSNSFHTKLSQQGSRDAHMVPFGIWLFLGALNVRLAQNLQLHSFTDCNCSLGKVPCEVLKIVLICTWTKTITSFFFPSLRYASWSSKTRCWRPNGASSRSRPPPVPTSMPCSRRTLPTSADSLTVWAMTR